MHVRMLVRAPHAAVAGSWAAPRAAPLQFAAGTALATASPRTLAACRFAPDDAAGPGGACALVRGWLAGLAAICAALAPAAICTAPCCSLATHAGGVPLARVGADGPGYACTRVGRGLARHAAICAAADMGTAPAAASRRILEAYINLLKMHQQLACRLPRAALAAALACAARGARGAPSRTAMGVAPAAPTPRPLTACRLLGWHHWATRGVRERVVVALAVLRSLHDTAALRLYPGQRRRVTIPTISAVSGRAVDGDRAWFGRAVPPARRALTQPPSPPRSGGHFKVRARARSGAPRNAHKSAHQRSARCCATGITATSCLK